VQRQPSAVRAEAGPPLPWGEAELADLLATARGFERVGPAALADPADLVLRVVAGLFGVAADQEGGRFGVSPWLPEGWRALALRRLRCHRTLLSVEVRPRAEWVTLRLEVDFGPAIPLRVALRNTGPISRVTVDEVPLDGPRVVFTLESRHEVVFFFS